MKMPHQTGQIFEILSKGQFINSNSSNKAISQLYETIDEEQNFENLFQYFQNINFILEKGDGYYYFSKVESKSEIERKIEIAFKWIDIMDFFKTYDNSFGAGYRFTPSDILVRIKIDAELESKLEGLSKYAQRDKHQDIVEKILKDLMSDTFIELENEITHQYKVLDSFKYLEQLILTIHIPEEVRNEIPE